MKNGLVVIRQASLSGVSVEQLRAAVGWDRMDGLYDRILTQSYTHFSVMGNSMLIGFMNVLSDGIADATLLDLMVHPTYQGKGLGKALVEHAVRELIADGIQFIQVVFEPSLENFYRACGFSIIKAGVIDRNDPNRMRLNEIGKIDE